MSRKPRVKAGVSKAAAARRRKRFRDAYIANGQNATQAAITAGYSPKTAKSAAHRLLTNVDVAKDIADAARELGRISGLDAERTLREVARVGYVDPRKFYRPDGSLMPITELDDDSAAAVASVEVDEIKVDGVVVGHTKKLKLWDKNAALEKAMKHHGLYEKDNAQQAESLVLKIQAAAPVKR